MNELLESIVVGNVMIGDEGGAMRMATPQEIEGLKLEVLAGKIRNPKSVIFPVNVEQMGGEDL